MRRMGFVSLGLLVLVALACNWPGNGGAFQSTQTPEADGVIVSPRPTDTISGSEAASTPEDALGEARGIFTVAILVDQTSESVVREAAEAVLRESSQILQERTGFVFELIDYQEMVPSGTIQEMAFTYLDTIAVEIPNGLVIFSFGDHGMARLYGGYSGWIAGPGDFRNDFVSPIAGDQHVYLAVIHWSHRFGICGYGGEEQVVSDVSIDGECRNHAGTPCVQKYGYSMCSTLVDDLYASTPTFFTAAGIVHEFLHPFGTGTNDDHYATPSCKEIMGWTDDNWSFSNEESQSYLNHCPYLYTSFEEGYQP
ncbi:MAG: hypothetical protein P8Z42_14330 [Anaerolineales bacterium]|jgi:hypothetical protein